MVVEASVRGQTLVPLIARAGPNAPSLREYFTANIRKANTGAAYAQAVGRF